MPEPGRLYPGELRALICTAALALLIFALIVLDIAGAALMRRLKLIAAALAALTACACTAAGLERLETGLSAAGLTAEAYCALTPEGRAALRARLGIEAQVIACEGGR